MKNNGLKTAFFFVLLLCVIMSGCSILTLIDHGVLTAGIDGWMVLLTLAVLPVVLIISMIVLFAMVDNQQLRYKAKL